MLHLNLPRVKSYFLIIHICNKPIHSLKLFFWNFWDLRFLLRCSLLCFLIILYIRCWVGWGGVFSWGFPVNKSFQLAVPLKLKFKPIPYYFFAKSSRIRKDFPTDLYQSLCARFLFLWNLIAWKSADSIPPLMIN